MAGIPICQTRGASARLEAKSLGAGPTDQSGQDNRERRQPEGNLSNPAMVELGSFPSYCAGATGRTEPHGIGGEGAR